MAKILVFIMGLFMMTPLFSGLPIKAVIFDCEGVLVDTEYLKFLAWQEALATKNIDLGPKLPLVSPRLILRDFVKEDIPQVINIASHSRFSGYLRFHPEKMSESVGSYIEEAIEMKKSDSGHREVFRLAVCLKDSPSHVIGCCVFHGWNKSPDNNDQIGYFIHPEHQGCGYATEALSCLLTPYFFQYPERNVEAIVHPDNLASQKVLKKLGFSQAGEKEIDAHGKREPRIIYTLSSQNFVY